MRKIKLDTVQMGGVSNLVGGDEIDRAVAVCLEELRAKLEDPDLVLRAHISVALHTGKGVEYSEIGIDNENEKAYATTFNAFGERDGVGELYSELTEQLSMMFEVSDSEVKLNDGEKLIQLESDKVENIVDLRHVKIF